MSVDITLKIDPVAPRGVDAWIAAAAIPAGGTTTYLAAGETPLIAMTKLARYLAEELERAM